MWWFLLATAHAVQPDARPVVSPLVPPSIVIHREDLPPMPPPDDSLYGAVDVGDVVVVRPQGNALREGFSYNTLEDAMEAALQDRSASYDFILALNTSRLPTQFTGAQAFYLAYNNEDHEGTGTSVRISPTMPVKAVLWMNTIDTWEGDVEYSGWVFGQELGHHWLAFPYVDLNDGAGRQASLLGRDNSHWSYFTDSTNSPAEGNKWIDNGDGSFTTDMDHTPEFSPLDLYMMGLISAEEVPPWFYIEPDDNAGRGVASPPEWLYGFNPVTVTGTRVDVTIDDVIAAETLRLPTPETSAKDFRILTMLVLTPGEILSEDIMAGVATRQAEWADAWYQMTGERSNVLFTIDDEGRAPPPVAASVALVPRGAW